MFAFLRWLDRLTAGQELALWVACFVVVQTAQGLLDTEEGIGPAATFWMYGGVCVVAFFFVALFIPETKGKTLEEIEQEWTK